MTTYTDAEIERIEQRLTNAGLGMEDDPQSIAKLTLKEVTDAVCVIRQLLEERRWRPIEEEEPPINESVLIFIPNAYHYGPGIYRAILVDMGNGREWKTFGWAIGRSLPEEVHPTEWKPLGPTPPQDGEA